MTSSSTTPKPWLVGAIRVAAALTVVGSAVAATALTVRSDDPVSVVVSQEQARAAALSTAAAPAPAAPAPGTAAPVPLNGSAPAASVPLGGAAPTPHAGAPAPAASVPLGGAGVPASTVLTNGQNGSVPPGTGTPNNSVPLGTGAPSNSVPLGTGAPSNSVPLNTAPGTATPLGASPFATPSVNTQPPCPLGWPAPKQQGGLASLIGLAPLAGPFSSEAFALGSVYQPILQLVGPVLAEIAPVITRFQPQIDPLITQVQGVEAIVLQAILPYYGPYRDQLIAAEGDFAKAIAPILTNAYNSPVASCFVAWQGQIIDQAKGAPIKVASLAHPGAVIELGPKPEIPE